MGVGVGVVGRDEPEFRPDIAGSCKCIRHTL